MSRSKSGLLAMTTMLLLGACESGSAISANNNNATGNNNNNNVIICGDGVIAPQEQCDGDAFGGTTCETLGFSGGTLACTGNCQLDTTGCDVLPTCGDGVLDPDEDCDGSNLGGQTCTGLGYGDGILSCTPACIFDASGCSAAPVCGNGILEPPEACDGADLGSQSCESLGMGTGTLACTAACQQLDTSNCAQAPVCGDGVLDPGEVCDTNNLGSATCVSLGYAGGQLACTASCTFDTSGCTAPTCGNGALDAGEECDDGNQTNGDGCSSTCMWENVCSANSTISCGGTVAGDLDLADNSVSGSCGNSGSGDDDIYSFVAPSSGMATAYLDVCNGRFSSDDSDLYVLEDTCNPALCVGYSASSGDDTLTFQVTAGMTYYLVVEQYYSAGGFCDDNYTLELTCP